MANKDDFSGATPWDTFRWITRIHLAFSSGTHSTHLWLYPIWLLHFTICHLSARKNDKQKINRWNSEILSTYFVRNVLLVVKDCFSQFFFLMFFCKWPPSSFLWSLITATRYTSIKQKQQGTEQLFWLIIFYFNKFQKSRSIKLAHSSCAFMIKMKEWYLLFPCICTDYDWNNKSSCD